MSSQPPPQTGLGASSPASLDQRSAQISYPSGSNVTFSRSAQGEINPTQTKGSFNETQCPTKSGRTLFHNSKSMTLNEFQCCIGGDNIAMENALLGDRHTTETRISHNIREMGGTANEIAAPLPLPDRASGSTPTFVLTMFGADVLNYKRRMGHHTPRITGSNNVTASNYLLEDVQVSRAQHIARNLQEEKIEKERQYVQTLTDWHSVPRGRDTPSGLLNSRWNRKQETLIITRSTRKDRNPPQWGIYSNYKTKYNFASQNPKIDFTRAERGFSLNVENLRKFRVRQPKNGNRPEFITEEQNVHRLAIGAITVSSITKLRYFFEHQQNMGGLPDSMQQQMATYFRTDADDARLILTVFLMSKKGFYREGTPLAADLKANLPYLVIVRNALRVAEHADTFINRLLIANQNLPYSHFADAVGSADYISDKILEKPSDFKQLTHMLKPEDQKSVHSFSVIYKFRSRREYQTKFSVGALSEFIYAQKQLVAYTGSERFHTARIISISGAGFVHAQITLPVVEGTYPPKFGENTKAKVVFFLMEFTPEQEMPCIKKELPLDVRVVDGDDGDVDIFCTFDIKDLSLIEVGVQYNISLVVDQNKTIVTRQLKAVFNMSRTIKPDLTGNTIKGYDIQQSLLCSGIAHVENHQPLMHQKINDELIAHVTSYINAASLSRKQSRAVDSVLKTTNLFSLVGGSGYGRKKTLATVATAVSMFDKHVLICAPTNVATEKIIGKLLKQQDMLKKICPERVQSTSIIYFEKLTNLKMRLREPLSNRDQADHSFIKRFLDLMHDDTKGDDEDRKQTAHDFLSMQNDIQQGVNPISKYGEEKMSQFEACFTTNWPRVMHEIEGQVTFVTTSNNAYVTHNGPMAFKPWIVIIADAASTLEVDTILPLSCEAERVLLFGDESQPKPIVLSYQANLEYDQMRLSLFTRMIKGGAPLFYV